MLGKIRVTLKGETPLLMNRLSIEKLSTKSRNIMKEYDVQADAADSAYMAEIDGVKQLYVPMECIYSMIIYSAGMHKVKKRSARSFVAGGIRIVPEKIPLGTDQYEVDLRRVVIQRNSVVRARAKVPDWRASFEIIYDQEILAPEVIYEILVDAGRRVGLLDFRPQRSGWFGTFTVEEFEHEE